MLSAQADKLITLFLSELQKKNAYFQSKLVGQLLYWGGCSVLKPKDGKLWPLILSQINYQAETQGVSSEEFIKLLFQQETVNKFMRFFQIGV